MPESVRLYLVLYDISEPRRWRRVFKTLKAHGAWAQLSVFFCRLPEARAEKLEEMLKRAINPATDRLLVIDLGDAVRAPLRIAAYGAINLPGEPQLAIV